MHIVYLLVVLSVAFLLLAVPLFPFWKAWGRLRARHPDLWTAKGPFALRDFIADPSTLRDFLDVVSLAEHDAALKELDPELVQWCRLSVEVWRTVPATAAGRLVARALFIALAGFLSNLIMKVFT